MFGWRPAQVRRALRMVVQADPCQVVSHHLDAQAAARLLALGSDPYPFARVDVGDACQYIDVLSAVLALRRAQALGQVSVDNWGWLSLGELSGAADRVLAVVSDPVKTLIADKFSVPAVSESLTEKFAEATALERLQRDMLLLTVLGDSEVFEQLRGALLAFGQRCHHLTEPAMLRHAGDHFDRLIRLLQAPAWAAAAAVDGQFEALMLQLQVQRNALVATSKKQALP